MQQSTYAIGLEARSPGEQRAEPIHCSDVHEPQINMLFCDVPVRDQCSHVHEPQIHMLSTTCSGISNVLDAQHSDANLNERLQHLSEKLKDLRQGSNFVHGINCAGVSGGRSETQQLPRALETTKQARCAPTSTLNGCAAESAV